MALEQHLPFPAVALPEAGDAVQGPDRLGRQAVRGMDKDVVDVAVAVGVLGQIEGVAVPVVG